jgi:hypothetical protein
MTLVRLNNIHLFFVLYFDLYFLLCYLTLTVSTGKTLPVLLNDRFKSFTGLITSDDCTMVGDVTGVDDTAVRVSVFKFSIGAAMVIVGVVIRSVDASVLWLVLPVGSLAGMFAMTSECCCLAFLIADAASPPLTLTSFFRTAYAWFTKLTNLLN